MKEIFSKCTQVFLTFLKKLSWVQFVRVTKRETIPSVLLIKDTRNWSKKDPNQASVNSSSKEQIQSTSSRPSWRIDQTFSGILKFGKERSHHVHQSLQPKTQHDPPGVGPSSGPDEKTHQEVRKCLQFWKQQFQG